MIYYLWRGAGEIKTVKKQEAHLLDGWSKERREKREKRSKKASDFSKAFCS